MQKFYLRFLILTFFLINVIVLLWCIHWSTFAKFCSLIYCNVFVIIASNRCVMSIAFAISFRFWACCSEKFLMESSLMHLSRCTFCSVSTVNWKEAPWDLEYLHLLSYQMRYLQINIERHWLIWINNQNMLTRTPELIPFWN